jgi:hypothetical protein
MRIVTYLFFVLCVFFVSCEERVDLLLETKSKLLVECELEANKKIVANVYMLNEFDNVVRDSVVKDAMLILTTGVDEQITFTYDENNNNYFVDPNLHVPLNERAYSLQAYHPEDKLMKMKASLKMPLSNALVAEVKNNKFEKISPSENTSQLKFSIKAKMQNLEQGKTFFKLQLFQPKGNKTEAFKFEGNTEDPLAFQVDLASGTVLMDVSRVNSQEFYLNYSTISKFQAGEKPSKIFYTLTSLTEHSYRYHIAKNKMFKASLNGSKTPAVMYSNFDSGYGFFGARASATDTVKIN